MVHTLNGLARVAMLPRSQTSPVFCSSVCIQYNTQKQKNGEKLDRGRLELIHHMSGCEVDVGGQYVRTKLKCDFLPVKTSSFDHANV